MKPRSHWVKQVLLDDQEGELGEELHEADVPLGERHAGPQLGKAEGEVPLGEKQLDSDLKMDYLLSLVGEDQDTITEAIKELAQNGEKVKLQEKEIEELKSELNDAKDDIKYLGHKLEKKYDLIE